jgi:predicted RNA-binding Zn ribbon-like protein
MAFEPRPDQLAFPFSAGRLSLDFAGTVGQRGGLHYERLRDPDDLARWLVEAGLLSKLPRVDERGLSAARMLREAAYDVVRAAARGEPLEAARVRLLNEFAAAPTTVPQLDPATGAVFWRAHRPVSAALAGIARDAVELGGSPLIDRVKECAADDCTLLFLDLSRSQRRRWCSMERCGNRKKTSTYRRRQKESA